MDGDKEQHAHCICEEIALQVSLLYVFVPLGIVLCKQATTHRRKDYGSAIIACTCVSQQNL